jgi:predicted DNA-binding transcriptional regulator AlpA
MDTTQHSPFLRTREAADRVGLTESTLEKLRCLGGGPPFYRVGAKRVVYDASELDTWVRSKRFESTSTEDGGV